MISYMNDLMNDFWKLIKGLKKQLVFGLSAIRKQRTLIVVFSTKQPTTISITTEMVLLLKED